MSQMKMMRMNIDSSYRRCNPGCRYMYKQSKASFERKTD